MKPSSLSRGCSVLAILLIAGCAGDGGPRRGGSGGSGGDDEETGGSSGGGGSGTGGARAGSGGKGGSAGKGGSGGNAGSAGSGSEPDGGAGSGGGPDGSTSTPSGPHSKVITLDTTTTGANVMGDVAKFPLAINLTDANFDFSQAKSKGEDLRFATGDGAALPHAIELWDAAAKRAAVWVKVDVKGNNKTQTIKMSWGDAAASDASDSKKVFDTADGWAGAWHLSEAGNTMAGGYKDATANAADASQKAMSAAGTAPGRIGNALSLSSSMMQYLQVDGGVDKNKVFDMPDHMTYSIWVNPKSHTVEYQCMFSKGEGGFRIHFYGAADWTENKGKNIVEMCAEGTTSNDMCPVKPGATDVALGKWTLITAVHDHPKLTLYINGAQEATLSEPEMWKSDAMKAVSIGNNSSNLKRAFDGLLDEARVLNVSKDANWVKLDFESQKEGSKLLVFGETK
jgi:concanavalin A-like lectin/glucanase superfamily protein/uncharacterized protein DUF2341